MVQGCCFFLHESSSPRPAALTLHRAFFWPSCFPAPVRSYSYSSKPWHGVIEPSDASFIGVYPLSLYPVSSLFPEARRAFRMPCPAAFVAPRKCDTAGVWIDKRMLLRTSSVRPDWVFGPAVFLCGSSHSPAMIARGMRHPARERCRRVPCMMQNRAGRVRDACQNLSGRGLAFVLAGNRQHV